MKRVFFACIAIWCVLSASLLQAAVPDNYYQKVLGCWNGKVIGGALGMPREGAWWEDQLREFPSVTGYLSGVKCGWSFYRDHETVPMDGEWHTVTFRCTLPGFRPDTTVPAPIIGISPENDDRPVHLQVRNIRITGHDIPLTDGDFRAFNACEYRDGCFDVDSSFGGERSWIQLIDWRKMEGVKPGEPFEMTADIRYISGENRIGLAFDYYQTGVNGFGPDDDTSYQIVGLLALEEFGPAVTAENIGELWLRLLPMNPKGPLAEEIAFGRLQQGITPPASGDHEVGNAIGGQMKGEIWGLVCPGRPDLAAEYARRDGTVAHKEDGVYGEMFVAAMVSEAFVESDVKKLIETGLSVIPRDSKYARMVRRVLDEYESGRPWVLILRDVKKEYPSMCDPVYPECAIITLALLEGRGDFEYTVITAFYCGSDTDCDTATVGAVIGAVIGCDAIPDKWKQPIHNDFRCFVKGYENWQITDLCRRICRQGERVMRYHGKKSRF
ncbi:MAG: ADP-ribosylglycohydrolase family protein [Abditibacteriota bacterium]|nr:ADP-ribosylglycohydrolase family protein [Abditibacteriota bacterium]